MDADAQIKQKVKAELANYLGIDLEDIEDESTLTGDLHMKATEITDFMELLNGLGFESNGINLAELETFEELTDALNAHI
ncbi:MAG TPA: hypothetical protein VKC54_01250 [Patescibacteria group bacterium]|nr:hypothetical protein [Patescibacteria group bacterium]